MRRRLVVQGTFFCKTIGRSAILSITGLGGFRPSFAPFETLAPVAVSHHARLPLDQNTDSEKLPQSSVLSGWLVPGVASS